MKTYVINMKKDVEKRSNIVKQLTNQSEINYEIIEACEGKKLSAEKLKEFGYNTFREKYGNFGTLPAFGCAISHFSVYDRIIKDGLDCALVLEDDVLLGEDLSNLLPEISKFVLSKEEPTAILLTPDFIYNSKEKEVLNIGKYRILNFVGGYMTTGYVLNKQGAKILSEKLLPIRHVADDWGAFKKMGLNVYGIVPHLVSYSGELGEIGQSQRLLTKESLIKKIRHFLGRNKAKVYKIFQYIKGYRRSKKIW